MQVCEWKYLKTERDEDHYVCCCGYNLIFTKDESDPQQGKPWTFAKHVFPEMCSVFFASFLIFW